MFPHLLGIVDELLGQRHDAFVGRLRHPVDLNRTEVRVVGAFDKSEVAGGMRGLSLRRLLSHSIPTVCCYNFN